MPEYAKFVCKTCLHVNNYNPKVPVHMLMCVKCRVCPVWLKTTRVVPKEDALEILRRKFAGC
jgi:hypothetical protein